jgi:WD40 repeat protein
LNGHKNAVTSLHYNPVDKTIVSGGLDKLVKLWDIRTKTSVGSIGSHTAPVWAVKFNNNGKVIASGGESGILAIHSIK